MLHTRILRRGYVRLLPLLILYRLLILRLLLLLCIMLLVIRGISSCRSRCLRLSLGRSLLELGSLRCIMLLWPRNLLSIVLLLLLSGLLCVLLRRRRLGSRLLRILLLRLLPLLRLLSVLLLVTGLWLLLLLLLVRRPLLLLCVICRIVVSRRSVSCLLLSLSILWLLLGLLRLLRVLLSRWRLGGVLRPLLVRRALRCLRLLMVSLRLLLSSSVVSLVRVRRAHRVDAVVLAERRVSGPGTQLRNPERARICRT